MLVVGLTGGMGAGKSVVAQLFAQQGVPCLDADEVARDLVQLNQPAYQAIVQHFGADIVLASGALNRAKLRDLIFEDAAQKQWLENLLHPLIIAHIQERIKQWQSPYGVVVIPLLFEKGPFPFIHRTLLVEASEAMRLARIVKRDLMTPACAKKILAQQATRSARLSLAEDVIENEGDLTALKESVLKIHKRYLDLSKNEH